MSNILIDRELLQRLVDRHFELVAENAAYLNLMNRARVGNDPEVAHRYVTARLQETEKQLLQTQGLRIHLEKMLDDEDDDAFQRALSDLCPPR
jgi:hypothetical protein